MNKFYLTISIILIALLHINGQVPYLVKDINTVVGGSISSSPSSFTKVNNVFYFKTPNKLWVSDGTVVGTYVVKEFPKGYYLENFTNVNGILYFVDPPKYLRPEAELWKSDGTKAGTVLVKKIKPNSGNGWISDLINVNGVLFFQSNNGFTGHELWKTNGTEAGTVLVKDIAQYGDSSNPSNFKNINGTLYFSADNMIDGNELWKSDGTNAGTTLIKDIHVGASGSNPEQFVAVNNQIFFIATNATFGRELWKTDGSEVGTSLVKDIKLGTQSSTPNYLTQMNNLLYFNADDSNGNGRELWKSDGSSNGTLLVKDINSGSSSSTPTDILNFDGILYFGAIDYRGSELWKSDGTSIGTVIVKDVTSGGNSFIQSKTQVGNIIYFTTSDGINGNELWKTDGTAIGTSMVKNIATGSNDFKDSYPGNLINWNNELIFTANDWINGNEIWKSDGTQLGTSLFLDLLPSNGDSRPAVVINVGNINYFVANNGVKSNNLWKTDGTYSGTTLVKSIPIGSILTTSFTSINNIIYFIVINDVTYKTSLWKSDGTEAGTLVVKEFNFYPNAEIYNANGTLYMSMADDVNGVELWRSDGTAEGTILVKDINPGSFSSSLANFISYNNQVYFHAFTENNGWELWKTDGSGIGTFMVKDINVGTNNGVSNYEKMAVSNNHLYFIANDGTSGEELWKTDGTETGTSIVKDINPNYIQFDIPHYLTDVNGVLFFRFNDGVHGSELWKSDGSLTGTTIVKDIYPGNNDSYPNELVNINETLFFLAYNYDSNSSQIQKRLWKSDGTIEGTIPIESPINTFYSYPENLTKVDNLLYYKGADKIWKTDGIAIDSVFKSDFYLNNNYSFTTTKLSYGNGKLYFGTSKEHDNFDYGYELWAIGNCNEQNDISVYKPNTLVFNKVDLMGNSNKKCHCDIFNSLISIVEPNGASPFSNELTSRVWTDVTAKAKYVTKHYEFIQPLNSNIASGRITLYFSQSDFDVYNSLNTRKLPINNGDGLGIGNLIVKKYSGESYNKTGLPETYESNVKFINPVDNNIVWNETASRWEITFDTIGLGGYFITTRNQFITTKSGDWNDPTIWSCGVVPTDLDDVIISPTHIIIMPDNVIGHANNLENNGNLIFGQNASLNLAGQ